jgi:hypothetical protein
MNGYPYPHLGLLQQEDLDFGALIMKTDPDLNTDKTAAEQDRDELREPPTEQPAPPPVPESEEGETD